MPLFRKLKMFIPLLITLKHLFFSHHRGAVLAHGFPPGSLTAVLFKKYIFCSSFIAGSSKKSPLFLGLAAKCLNKVIFKIVLQTLLLYSFTKSITLRNIEWPTLSFCANFIHILKKVLNIAHFTVLLFSPQLQCPSFYPELRLLGYSVSHILAISV